MDTKFIQVKHNLLINVNYIIRVEHKNDNEIYILYLSFGGIIEHNAHKYLKSYSIKKIDDEQKYNKLLKFFFNDCVL